jgi:uncharacterized protein YhfF
MHPSVTHLWKAFLESGVAPADAGAQPAAWHFCDTPAEADECAELVRTGRKVATAPSLWGLQARGEPIPRVGDHHIVTDWAGVAQCVIRTEDVTVVRFDQVTANHAAAEGEGDGTLAHWRETHRAYYARELSGTGLVPTEDMPLVCERFRLVYPPK